MNTLAERQVAEILARAEPDPRDELLNLAVLFGGLAFWLWMAWLWGWA